MRAFIKPKINKLHLRCSLSYMSSNKQDKLSISTCGLHNIEKNLVNINDTLIVHIARKPDSIQNTIRGLVALICIAFIGLVRVELLVCAVYSVGTQYNCKYFAKAIFQFGPK